MKEELPMKKNFFALSSAALILCAAVSLTSCNDIERPAVSDNGTISITFEQVDPELPASADEATRTGYHEKTIWWSAGDKVAFGQYASVGGDMTYKSSSVTINSDTEILTASISKFNTPDDATDSYYFSVYPGASFTNYSTSSGHVRARINTPAGQTPTASSFDPAADLLISNYAENLTKNGEGKYSVQLSYYRQVALGKMRIINLPSASEIDSVVFSAVCDDIDVTLAGAKWYDFTTQGPYSVYSRSYKLTLDYSAQNISGDMTAHFCCYPFSLDAGDNFTVKVYTKAGEVFTRKVNLTGAQTLTLEAAHGTQFTVDMSSAKKTANWMEVKEYKSSTYTKTATKIYYRPSTTKNTVASGYVKAVSETTFDNFSSLAEIDESLSSGTAITSAQVDKLNSTGTTSLVYSYSGLTPDTWYVAMCKLVLSDDSIGYAFTRIRTDWFTLTASTRAAGGVSYTFYGKNISSSSRNVRVMATSDLPDGQSFEEYYTNTLAPGGITESTLNAINQAGASGKGYYTTKYYSSPSVTSNMTAGVNYTVMIKATNERGETKFVSASADAGGSTE